ncbi:helix-turn-helix transcriptional regulator [Phascolarctobacterium sp.]|uniref:helix-turn-helix transcriptional regulator n=1 Tax=Phascolarctobacterium sp. TaxID=2049039 RepID=UPI00386C22C0
MASTKESLLKVLQIMERTDKDHPLNSTEICQILLDEENMVVERKSVTSSIHLLMDCGYGIAQCENMRRGFYMEHKRFEDYQLKILADAVNAAKYLNPKETRELLRSIKSLASKQGKKIINTMSFMDEDLKTSEKNNGLKMETILKAISNKHKIAIQSYTYDKNNKRVLKRNGKKLTLNPYYLILNNNEYYLLANFEPYANLAYMRVDMMATVEELDETVKPKEEIPEFAGDFDIAKYVRSTVNGWTGEQVDVFLECENHLRQYIQRHFGNNLFFMGCTDTHFTVHFKVTDSEGFYGLVASLGNTVRIVKPEHIKEKYKQYLQDILAKY